MYKPLQYNINLQKSIKIVLIYFNEGTNVE